MDRSRISITRHVGKLWGDIPSSFVKWAIEEAKNFKGFTLEKLIEECQSPRPQGARLVKLRNHSKIDKTKS